MVESQENMKIRKIIRENDEKLEEERKLKQPAVTNVTQAKKPG